MIKIPDLKELSSEQKDVLIVELITNLNAMTARINALETRLNKDSHNSSKPPSTDGFQRKPKSLRQMGGKVGGQPGHPGKTLKRLAHLTILSSIRLQLTVMSVGVKYRSTTSPSQQKHGKSLIYLPSNWK